MHQPRIRERAALVALFACLAVSVVTPVASAKNVDLVTLPDREGTELTIYNAEDLTLVRERRSVTLRKGENRLQFSWAGTLIDPTSVELRPLEKQNQVEIIDTVFPGQKPQHLIWNVQSEFDGSCLVEVCYFTSGLTWRMDYTAIANPDETKMDFRGFVRVYNNSGEEYENATVRLIVGKIQLVEKIAELARRSGLQTVPKADNDRYRRLKNRAAAKVFSAAAEAARDSAGASEPSGAKKIVKEGVSEYFMFTVKGNETIRNGWSKRMNAITALDAKFDIVYRLRDYQYGVRPQRFFIWRNDTEHELGDSPLPNGQVRVLRKTAADGLRYLGQQTLHYVPIDAEIEVNLGVDDLVVYERRNLDTARDNFLFHGNNYVSGWDEHRRAVHEIRNYRDKPIRIEVRLQYAGDVEFESEIPVKSFDYRTIEATFEVPSRGAEKFPHRVTIHQGSAKKQDRVRISGN